MEALRFIETVHNGGIFITLPKEFDEQEMELIIKPLHEKKQEDNTLPRLEIAEAFVSKLKTISFNREDFNVYDQ